jgi:hypothetical protein
MERWEIAVWCVLSALAVAFAYRVDTRRENTPSRPWEDQ